MELALDPAEDGSRAFVLPDDAVCEEFRGFVCNLEDVVNRVLQLLQSNTKCSDMDLGPNILMGRRA